MALARKEERKRFGNGELLQQAPLKSASPLAKCLNDVKNTWKKQSNLAGLWQEWPRLAGDQLAKNCRPLSLNRGVLVIGASHPNWRQALQYNRMQLLAALKAAGHEVKDLRIQQHYPSSPKQLESEESLWARHPSRIDVHGMDNCKICKSPAPAGEMALWGKCGFCRREELSSKTTSEE